MESGVLATFVLYLPTMALTFATEDAWILTPDASRSVQARLSHTPTLAEATV